MNIMRTVALTKESTKDILENLLKRSPNNYGKFEAAVDEILNKVKTEGDAWILGADTVVVYDQKILGKPKDAEDAKRMLCMLQDKKHQVYTGVCIWKKENGTEDVRCFFEKTDVVFYPMTEEEIDQYVATGEPMDKAGSYGIQGVGGLYVREIHGDYNNVVGLPIARLYHELKK